MFESDDMAAYLDMMYKLKTLTQQQEFAAWCSYMSYGCENENIRG